MLSFKPTFSLSSFTFIKGLFFTIINPPQVPLKRSNTSKSTILLASIFLGAVVAAVWILWGRDTLAKLKKNDDEEEAPAKA